MNKKIKFCTAFYQQFKCFNHKCQMPKAYFVFKQSVHDVSAHQLQLQYSIEICYKTIQLSYQ